MQEAINILDAAIEEKERKLRALVKLNFHTTDRHSKLRLSIADLKDARNILQENTF